MLNMVTVEVWGEGKFADGVGAIGKIGWRGEVKTAQLPNPPTPTPATTFYRSSVQLQSKMAASKTWSKITLQNNAWKKVEQGIKKVLF